MNAPIRSTTDYELYRVITDYEALQDGFMDRIDDLETTMGSIPNFADGQVQRLLSKNPGKAIARKRDHRHGSLKRTFGWETLGKMLEGTGLALVLVVDDERFKPVKEQLARRRRKAMHPIARIIKPAWLFKRKKAIEMGKKRWEGVSDSKRKRLAKRAAKARWKRGKSVAPKVSSAAAALEVGSTQPA